MEKDRLENKKIAIIGFGHMGQALFEGLINSGFNKQNILTSSDKKNNKKNAQKADWIIVAVKPFQVKEVIKEIRTVIRGKILLSVAATVDMDLLEKYCKNPKQKIIRLMPNIPISKNQGVIGIYPNRNINTKDEKQITELVSGLGEVIKVKSDKEIDILTLISACGPAIISYFIELLTKYGETKDFFSDDSLNIVLRTFEGTLNYLKKTKLTPTQLKESVATKGGITEKIINDLIKEKLNIKFEKSMEKGFFKIKEIKNKLIL